MDKLKRLFVFNKKVFVFLFCLMIIGIIFGSSLPVFLNSDDKSLVSQYLSDFIVQVKSGCDSLFLLRNGLSNNVYFLFQYGFLVLVLLVFLLFYFYFSLNVSFLVFLYLLLLLIMDLRVFYLVFFIFFLIKLLIWLFICLLLIIV